MADISLTTPSPKRKSTPAGEGPTCFEPAPKSKCRTISAPAPEPVAPSASSLPSIHQLLSSSPEDGAACIGRQKDGGPKDNAIEKSRQCKECNEWYSLNGKDDSMIGFVCEQCNHSEASTELCSSPSSSSHSDSFSLLLNAAVEARMSRSASNSALVSADGLSHQSSHESTIGSADDTAAAPSSHRRPASLAAVAEAPTAPPIGNRAGGRRGRAGRSAARSSRAASAPVGEPQPVTPVRAYLRETLGKPRPNKPNYGK